MEVGRSELHLDPARIAVAAVRPFEQRDVVIERQLKTLEPSLHRAAQVGRQAGAATGERRQFRPFAGARSSGPVCPKPTFPSRSRTGTSWSRRRQQQGWVLIRPKQRFSVSPPLTHRFDGLPDR